jgi:hypothetical protein
MMRGCDEGFGRVCLQGFDCALLQDSCFCWVKGDIPSTTVAVTDYHYMITLGRRLDGDITAMVAWAVVTAMQWSLERLGYPMCMEE